MYNIKKMNKISPVIYDYLPKELFHVTTHMDDSECDAFIVRSADCLNMEITKRLLAIARAGAGVNNIPVERCTENGVVVFNTPGANANGVKELVIGCMIAASRNLFEAYDWIRAQKGKDDLEQIVEKGKSQFVGNELAGKTLGVIGLGAIGVLVANTASAIGMDVIGYDPYLSVDRAWTISTRTHRAETIDELLGESNFITLHIPQSEKTKDFLSSHEFIKMMPGVILLNFARGGLIKKTALYEALDNGTIKKYITDFPHPEMIGRENIITIPHLGASTPESEENCAIMAARELQEFLESGSITNSVNMPECALSPVEHTRVTVIHKNLPNMVGQITKRIAEKNLNIADMINKSRGETAYTAINFEDSIPEGLDTSIEEIDGVIKVRTINRVK